MATTRPSSTASPAHPFADMTKLSPQVWLREPPSTSTAPSTSASPSQNTTAPAPPSVILFASWMGARDVHIAKYTSRYATLYPSAAILVAKFEAAQLWGGEAAGRRAVEAAVVYLKARAASGELDDSVDSSKGRPRVLIHLFSNGGATTMQNIYLAWQHHHPFTSSSSPSLSLSLTPKSTPFPASVAIYDSAPGLPTLLRTYRAFSISALPQGNSNIRKRILRAVLTPLLAALCVLSWVYMHVLLRRVLVPLGLAGEDVLSRNFTLLNDAGRVDGDGGSGSSSGGKSLGARGEARGGLIGSQTLRTYIYSKQDAMIDWRHVEMHAADAATGGDNKSANNNNNNNNNSSRRTKIPCRLEMFHGSGHVAHMRHDPERYWRVVVETWEQGCR